MPDMNRIILLSSLLVLAFVGSGDKVGVQAPSFSGTTAEGAAVSLADYQGQVVLLDFWASWCGPCKEEMPFLIGLHRQYKSKGLAVVAINIDDDVANMRAFLSSLPGSAPAFPIIWDHEKNIPAQYEIEAMPTSVLIDRGGVVRFWHNGFKSSARDQFRKEVEQLLREQ